MKSVCLTCLLDSFGKGEMMLNNKQFARKKCKIANIGSPP